MTIHKHFWSGFEKRASGTMELEASPSQRQAPQQSGVMSRVGDIAGKAAPYLAAGAAGLGTYKALRHGKFPKVHATMAEGGIPKYLKKKFPYLSKKMGPMEKEIAPFFHGADEVHTFDRTVAPPAKPTKLDGIVRQMGDSRERYFTGDQVVGSVKKRQDFLRDMQKGKAPEYDIVNKYNPEAGTKSFLLSDKKHRGIRNFKKLHAEQGGKDYFIKPSYGEGSSEGGIGGKAFIHSKDVDAYLAGKPMRPGKKRQLEEIVKDPQRHMLQHDVHIAKDPITGSSREFRVHAIGDKVVRGGTSIRGANISDQFSHREAEDFLQNHLDKLPKHMKGKDAWHAADVARTEDGKMKLIETGATMAGGSGFQDTFGLLKRYKSDPSKGFGVIPALGAMKTNNAIYKHLTGRAHSSEAAMKAVGATGVTLGAGKLLHNQIAKKKQNEGNAPVTAPLPVAPTAAPAHAQSFVRA